MYPLTNTSLFTSCLRVTTPFTKPKAISFRGKKKASNTSSTILAQESMAAKSAVWVYRFAYLCWRAYLAVSQILLLD